MNANSSESEESEVEHIECVVCGKIFKSEKQFETHEKSKKHIKAVQQLQREMRKDNDRLDLDDTSRNHTSPISEFEELDLGARDAAALSSDSKGDIRNHSEEHLENRTNNPSQTGGDVKVGAIADEASDRSGDDEYASREHVESRVAGTLLEDAGKVDADRSSAATPAGSDADSQRVGKAKLKRAKKKAKQEQAANEHNEVSSSIQA